MTWEMGDEERRRGGDTRTLKASPSESSECSLGLFLNTMKAHVKEKGRDQKGSLS